MKVEGILFDKDGTLIDFDKVWGSAAVPVVKRLLAVYGIADSEEHRNVVLDSLGVSCGKVDPNGALAWKTYPMIAEELLPVLRQMADCPAFCQEKLAADIGMFFEEELFESDRPIVETADLLGLMKFLKQRGIKLGIVTTDTYNATMRCLRKLGIASYFSFFSMDQMPVPMPVKPDGRIIKRAAEYWGVNPDQILVVGDTPNDMQFARNGGARAVGVLSGTGSVRDLEPVADCVLKDVGELPKLICRMEMGIQR